MIITKSKKQFFRGFVSSNTQKPERFYGFLDRYPAGGQSLQVIII